MKKKFLLYPILITSLLLPGCKYLFSNTKESPNPDKPISFCSGAAPFTISNDAIKKMGEVETILMHRLSTNGKTLEILTEDKRHSLYLQTDEDNNRKITIEEARNKYQKILKDLETKRAEAPLY